MTAKKEQPACVAGARREKNGMFPLETPRRRERGPRTLGRFWPRLATTWPGRGSERAGSGEVRLCLAGSGGFRWHWAAVGKVPGAKERMPRRGQLAGANKRRVLVGPKGWAVRVTTIRRVARPLMGCGRAKALCARIENPFLAMIFQYRHGR